MTIAALYADIEPMLDAAVDIKFWFQALIRHPEDADIASAAVGIILASMAKLNNPTLVFLIDKAFKDLPRRCPAHAVWVPANRQLLSVDNLVAAGTISLVENADRPWFRQAVLNALDRTQIALAEIYDALPVESDFRVEIAMFGRFGVDLPSSLLPAAHKRLWSTVDFRVVHLLEKAIGPRDPAWGVLQPPAQRFTGLRLTHFGLWPSWTEVKKSYLDWLQSPKSKIQPNITCPVLMTSAGHIIFPMKSKGTNIYWRGRELCIGRSYKYRFRRDVLKGSGSISVTLPKGDEGNEPEMIVSTGDGRPVLFLRDAYDVQDIEDLGKLLVESPEVVVELRRYVDIAKAK